MNHLSFRMSLVILLACGMIAICSSSAVAQDAAATYKAKCAMCHGADGTGNTPIGKNLKLRSFKSPEDLKATDAELAKQTKDGVGKMQGYAGKLTDAQLAALHDAMKERRAVRGGRSPRATRPPRGGCRRSHAGGR